VRRLETSKVLPTLQGRFGAAVAKGGRGLFGGRAADSAAVRCAALLQAGTGGGGGLANAAQALRDAASADRGFRLGHRDDAALAVAVRSALRAFAGVADLRIVAGIGVDAGVGLHVARVRRARAGVVTVASVVALDASAVLRIAYLSHAQRVVGCAAATVRVAHVFGASDAVVTFSVVAASRAAREAALGAVAAALELTLALNAARVDLARAGRLAFAIGRLLAGGGFLAAGSRIAEIPVGDVTT